MRCTYSVGSKVGTEFPNELSIDTSLVRGLPLLL